MKIQNIENQEENFTKRMDHLMNDVLNVTGYRIKNDLNMSLSGVYGIMAGKFKPGMDFISKFCMFYGVSANYFVLGVGPELLNTVDNAQDKVGEIVSNRIEEVVSMLNEVKEKYGK